MSLSYPFKDLPFGAHDLLKMKILQWLQFLVKNYLQDKSDGLEIRIIHAIGSSKKQVFALESEHISRVTSDIILKNLQVWIHTIFG